MPSELDNLITNILLSTYAEGIEDYQTKEMIRSFKSSDELKELICSYIYLIDDKLTDDWEAEIEEDEIDKVPTFTKSVLSNNILNYIGNLLSKFMHNLSNFKLAVKSAKNSKYFDIIDQHSGINQKVIFAAALYKYIKLNKIENGIEAYKNYLDNYGIPKDLNQINKITKSFGNLDDVEDESGNIIDPVLYRHLTTKNPKVWKYLSQNANRFVAFSLKDNIESMSMETAKYLTIYSNYFINEKIPVEKVVEVCDGLTNNIDNLNLLCNMIYKYIKDDYKAIYVLHNFRKSGLIDTFDSRDNFINIIYCFIASSSLNELNNLSLANKVDDYILKSSFATSISIMFYDDLQSSINPKEILEQFIISPNKYFKLFKSIMLDNKKGLEKFKWDIKYPISCSLIAYGLDSNMSWKNDLIDIGNHYVKDLEKCFNSLLNHDFNSNDIISVINGSYKEESTIEAINTLTEYNVDNPRPFKHRLNNWLNASK